ncbi:MAG: hypothetical protein AB7V16_07430 [Vulcanibacillus sp.]
MVSLTLYEALVVDINDETKKRKVKVRLLPEHKDVKEVNLPWASPFTGANDELEFENDLPEKDSVVYILVDKYFKRFYYIGNKYFYNLFDYAKVEDSLSNASEVSNTDYKNIKFRLYPDGGLEFHNKIDGSHGFIHKSGNYSIFDSTGKVFIKADSIELNGNSKQFVTHAELDSALQTFINALNLHTHPTAGSGPPSPPTSPLSINITSAKTTTVVTGG